MTEQATILNVEHLNVTFSQRSGLFARHQHEIPALRDISLKLKNGKVLAVIGESGCGKSTLAKCIAGLITPTSGQVVMPSRHNRVQYVFQDPFASLNPGMTIEQIILEPLDYQNSKQDRSARLSRLEKIFNEVGLDFATRHRYPHEFSGGQCQRVAIARALIAEPDLLVCDEPVSALDVSVRAQVINLLRELNRTRGLSQIFIAHDLGLARYLGDDIIVMYQGRIVEAGQCATIFARPQHPYTQDLIASIPQADPVQERRRQQEEHRTAGQVPATGCAYAGRCRQRQEKCRQQIPGLQQTVAGGQVACFYPVDAWR